MMQAQQQQQGALAGMGGMSQAQHQQMLQMQQQMQQQMAPQGQQAMAQSQMGGMAAQMGGMPGMGGGGMQVPTQAGPGETRICFPFLNKGVCERGALCKFRHLTPDHPDAVADRAKNGRNAQPPDPASCAAAGACAGASA